MVYTVGMHEAETELVSDGSKRDERGRRITPRAERERLVALYESSGLTQKEFARREGIKYPTFTVWLSKQRRRLAASDSAPVRFEEFLLPGGTSGMKLEIQLPDGTIVRGGDAGSLVELVKRLRG